MAKLFGDENFSAQALVSLKDLGHDTQSIFEAGLANQKITDREILEYASRNDRAVLTFDRRDYYKLHQESPKHAGIIACTFNPDNQELAQRIDQEISRESGELEAKFIRVYRPNT
jgi:predicted nuclease of predicted toxin-antitoxin system